MSKRTKALQVSYKTREIVINRDKWCILCGNPRATDMAHFVSRSKGGLGIEQNIVLLCRNCHHRLDHTTERKELLILVENYLKTKYGNWNREELIYRK